ncbi:CAP domain-containing protein [Cyanobacterium sp. Dongsha4]|uniref:CAP domain-containing protein n=1 Tax=Cyanobacterium sp. DS4 TaxID=2878255 RepID=UPI002E803DE3|nr:CAP domain-containing protein [Cyanobacterium sp. Dongsha4]WVL01722.1 CAP domain-containing protein [Cyanobacterium sp. Dongsha4]
MRYSSSKFKKFKWQYLITIFVVLLTYGRDEVYFFNGLGGENWTIGFAKANIGNSLPGRSLTELSDFALMLVNRDRQLNGLSPLEKDSLITKTAQLHAEDMAKRNYFSHGTPEGLSPTDRYVKLGGLNGIGENIVFREGGASRLSYAIVEVFQRSLMYSDGHRQNLLNPNYTKFGYGIAVDPLSRKIYAVQNFQ